MTDSIRNSMADAPRDGTRILVRDLGFDGDHIVVFWDGYGWATGFGSEIDGESIRAENPKCWFPLPVGDQSRFGVGASFRRRGRKCHVRGRIDDEIVFRWWSRYKQRWVYESEP